MERLNSGDLPLNPMLSKVFREMRLLKLKTLQDVNSQITCMAFIPRNKVGQKNVAQGTKDMTMRPQKSREWQNQKLG